MERRYTNHSVSRTTNATNARKNLFQIIADANTDGVPVHIISPRGNAVLLSEQEYNGLVETMYLQSIPGMAKSIREGLDEPFDGMTKLEDVEW